MTQEKFTFRKRLLSAWSFGKKLLAFWNRLASEPDTLLGIEYRTLPHQTLDAASTTVYLIEGHLIDDFGAMFSVSSTSVCLCHFSSRSGRVDYFRSALTCSIFSGSSSANRSLRLYSIMLVHVGRLTWLQAQQSGLACVFAE